MCSGFSRYNVSVSVLTTCPCSLNPLPDSTNPDIRSAAPSQSRNPQSGSSHFAAARHWESQVSSPNGPRGTWPPTYLTTPWDVPPPSPPVQNPTRKMPKTNRVYTVSYSTGGSKDSNNPLPPRKKNKKHGNHGGGATSMPGSMSLLPVLEGRGLPLGVHSVQDHLRLLKAFLDLRDFVPDQHLYRSVRQ